MSGFQVGDEVVCVNDGLPRPPLVVLPGPGVVRGQHYTISASGRWWFTTGHWVKIGEFGGDFKYDACRFRPVKREEIELFRQMCASPKPLVPVGTDEDERDENGLPPSVTAKLREAYEFYMKHYRGP